MSIVYSNKMVFTPNTRFLNLVIRRLDKEISAIIAQKMAITNPSKDGF